MKRLVPLLALLPVLFLGVGCGGINTTQSVSPMMFLLPGFGKVQPQKPEEKKVETTASLPQKDGTAVKSL